MTTARDESTNRCIVLLKTEKLDSGILITENRMSPIYLEERKTALILSLPLFLFIFYVLCRHIHAENNHWSGGYVSSPSLSSSSSMDAWCQRGKHVSFCFLSAFGGLPCTLTPRIICEVSFLRLMIFLMRYVTPDFSYILIIYLKFSIIQRN